jgi:hypothetical protein
VASWPAGRAESRSPGGEGDRSWPIPIECCPVDSHVKWVSVGGRKPTGLRRSEADAPFGEDLAESKGHIGGGLHVDDARGVVTRWSGAPETFCDESTRASGQPRLNGGANSSPFSRQG